MPNQHKYPELRAVVGNDPSLAQDGKRVLFPRVEFLPGEGAHKRYITVNEGGGAHEGLEGYDRLALLWAAAPRLLKAAEAFCAAMDACSEHPDTSGDREALRVAAQEARAAVSLAVQGVAPPPGPVHAYVVVASDGNKLKGRICLTYRHGETSLGRAQEDAGRILGVPGFTLRVVELHRLTRQKNWAGWLKPGDPKKVRAWVQRVPDGEWAPNPRMQAVMQ